MERQNPHSPQALAEMAITRYDELMRRCRKDEALDVLNRASGHGDEMNEVGIIICEILQVRAQEALNMARYRVRRAEGLMQVVESGGSQEPLGWVVSDAQDRD